jgi:hypothetical protein
MELRKTGPPTAAALETKMTIPRSPSGLSSGRTCTRCFSTRRVRLKAPVRLTVMTKFHSSRECGLLLLSIICLLAQDINNDHISAVGDDKLKTYLGSRADTSAIDDTAKGHSSLLGPCDRRFHRVLNLIHLGDVGLKKFHMARRQPSVRGYRRTVEDGNVGVGGEKVVDRCETETRRTEE